MNYEKKYKEALSRALIWQNLLYETKDQCDRDYADELNYIFPELAESRDERIRKASMVKYLVSIGNLFWMLNGIFTSNVPLIVSNGFCLLVMGYEILKPKKGGEE